ncbi:hypothetical protein [Octadecabacter antarcticus]|uniref:hypothetical protein n=1 Tax=Octadecabacter antarcticus TaxID=1217908 RepID=UPI0002FF10C2|nr:hypothetical protein [Octadecabacter antarcticus]
MGAAFDWNVLSNPAARRAARSVRSVITAPATAPQPVPDTRDAQGPMPKCPKAAARTAKRGNEIANTA